MPFRPRTCATPCGSSVKMPPAKTQVWDFWKVKLSPRSAFALIGRRLVGHELFRGRRIGYRKPYRQSLLRRGHPNHHHDHHHHHHLRGDFGDGANRGRHDPTCRPACPVIDMSDLKTTQQVFNIVFRDTDGGVLDTLASEQAILSLVLDEASGRLKVQVVGGDRSVGTQAWFLGTRTIPIPLEIL